MIENLNIKNKDFFELVFQVVQLIPHGRVTSYGAIANYLGSKSGARMVGWAMNASHQYEGIPAHRVVNRNGLLSGKMHFPTPDSMQQALESEGINIQNDHIQHFSEIFWDPSKELNLP
jgi:methylated-DNA-protein-cysteine methyltransferase-like protein